MTQPIRTDLYSFIKSVIFCLFFHALLCGGGFNNSYKFFQKQKFKFFLQIKKIKILPIFRTKGKTILERLKFFKSHSSNIQFTILAYIVTDCSIRFVNESASFRLKRLFFITHVVQIAFVLTM